MITGGNIRYSYENIEIHKKKTLEIGQSGMGNLETLTLPYTTKRR